METFISSKCHMCGKESFFKCDICGRFTCLECHAEYHIGSIVCNNCADNIHERKPVRRLKADEMDIISLVTTSEFEKQFSGKFNEIECKRSQAESEANAGGTSLKASPFDKLNRNIHYLICEYVLILSKQSKLPAAQKNIIKIIGNYAVTMATQALADK